MQKLSSDQIQYLKQLAHPLKPVVLLGAKGLTEAVQNEINVALEAHELIKVRVNAIDRKERDAMIAEICETQQALLVQQIGHLAVLYRKRKDKND